MGDNSQFSTLEDLAGKRLYGARVLRDPNNRYNEVLELDIAAGDSAMGSYYYSFPYAMNHPQVSPHFMMVSAHGFRAGDIIHSAEIEPVAAGNLLYGGRAASQPKWYYPHGQESVSTHGCTMLLTITGSRAQQRTLVLIYFHHPDWPRGLHRLPDVEGEELVKTWVWDKTQVTREVQTQPTVWRRFQQSEVV